MPEVFLKALTIARNLNGGTTHSLHRGRLRHAAPLPAAGERGPAAHPRRRQPGFLLTGHHEILIPLLVWGVLRKSRVASREKS